jgi:outer membrane protein OmpA-like peptidoglycan-associated protein
MYSLRFTAAILLASLAVMLAAGCQNQTEQTVSNSSSAEAEAVDSSVVNNDLLRPVQFSMKMYIGGSGKLLPENIDAQLAPLLEIFDDWDQVSKIVVVGHTDAEGSEASNLSFSIKRAQSIADKLVSYGVPVELFEIDGRGESSPIADNTSISGKQLNRRVEIYAEGLDSLDFEKSFDSAQALSLRN